MFEHYYAPIYLSIIYNNNINIHLKAAGVMLEMQFIQTWWHLKFNKIKH